MKAGLALRASYTSGRPRILRSSRVRRKIERRCSRKKIFDLHRPASILERRALTISLRRRLGLGNLDGLTLCERVRRVYNHGFVPFEARKDFDFCPKVTARRNGDQVDGFSAFYNGNLYARRLEYDGVHGKRERRDRGR